MTLQQSNLNRLRQNLQNQPCDQSTNAALFTAIFHSLKSIQSYLNQLHITCTQGNHLPMYFVHILY